MYKKKRLSLLLTMTLTVMLLFSSMGGQILKVYADNENINFDNGAIDLSLLDIAGTQELIGMDFSASSADLTPRYGSNGKFLAPIGAPVAGSIPISTRAQLEAIRNNLSGNYHLTNDIDLSGAEWVPIGGTADSFEGTFDGQGYVIRNLTITGNVQYAGLFGEFFYGTIIKNVGLEGTEINTVRADDSFAGGIAGQAAGIIENCYNTGPVSASASNSYVGGIAGHAAGIIENCYNTGEVSASTSASASASNSYVGGIAGHAAGIIENCYNTGDVYAFSSNYSYSSNSYAGGLVGYSPGSYGRIENCYNTGYVYASSSSSSLSSASSAGGIAGRVGGIIENCYNTGEVYASSLASLAGGIAGSFSGIIENCYNTGDVSAPSFSFYSSSPSNSYSYAGGIAGNSSSSTDIIENCYNTGDVYASSSSSSSHALHSHAGGTVGRAAGIIENCYNTGDVSASSSSFSLYSRSYAGGIAGNDYIFDSDRIENCYNTGDVSASAASSSSFSSSYAGGIVGDVSSVTIENCYWNSDSAQTINDDPVAVKKGVGNGTDTTTPLTTAQMKVPVNFIGFDFADVWSVSSSENNGYPYLRALPPSPTPIIPVHSTDERQILDAVDLEYRDILNNISLGHNTLRGPSVTIMGKTFYIFEFESEIELPLSDKVTLQVRADHEKKTVNILLGYKTLSGQMTIVGDPNSPEAEKDYWESYTQAKSLYKLLSGSNAHPSTIRNQFNAEYNKLQEFEMDMIVSAKGAISGYLELSYETGSWRVAEGGASAAIKIDTKLNGRIPAFPAAYVTMKFAVSAEGKLIVVAESVPTFDLEISAALKMSTGVGLGKNTGAFQGYIEGGFSGELAANVKPLRVSSPGGDGPLTVDLTGRIYFEWRLKAWVLGSGDTYSVDLLKLGIYPELGILPLSKAMRLPEMNHMGEFLRNAQPIQRDYLNTGNIRAARAALTDYSYYQYPVYPYAEPSLFAFPNGQLLLVWVGDTGEKAADERTSIMYSVYTPGAGWSASEVVHENGAYNDHPVLCQDGEDVRLIWMRADSPIQPGWDEYTLLEHMDLCYSTFNINTGVFSAPVVVSEAGNGLIETDHQIASDDGKTAVVWVENNQNDLLLDNGTNTIYLRVYEDGLWGAIETLYAGQDYITGLSVDIHDGEYSVIYTVSDASEVETTYAYRENAAASVLPNAGGLIQQSRGEVFSLLNNELYRDGEPTGLSGLTNFEIVTSDNRMAALTLIPTGFTCELYVSHYNESDNTWGELVQLTGFNKYIRDYAGTINDAGEIAAAFNLVDVDEESAGALFGAAALAVIANCDYSDLVMGDYVDYSPEDVKPGEDLRLTFEVTNNSVETVNRVNVALRDEEDRLINEREVMCMIAPGETTVLEVVYPLPSALTKHTVTLFVTPDFEDMDTSNNSAMVTIGHADIAIADLELKKTPRGGTITGVVSNNGFSPAADTYIVIKDANASGDELDTINIGTLAPGASEDFEFEVPEQYGHLPHDFMLFAIHFEAVSSGEEIQLSNNSDRIIFDGLFDTVGNKPGDINGDGDVNAADLSILLANFGKSGTAITNPAADINDDGDVNAADLSILLSNFGK